MNVGIIVLIVLGSLLVDAIVFFIFVMPRIRRARFLAFLQERGLEVELDGAEVSRARGFWEDLPCEVRFNADGDGRSLFLMKLPDDFPADTRVRFLPGDRGMIGDDAILRLRERLEGGELLEIESGESDRVRAIFGDPDVLPALLLLLRFQPKWSSIEGGHLRYELPILSRSKDFVVWIFDQMLPLARALDAGTRGVGRRQTPRTQEDARREVAIEEPTAGQRHVATPPPLPPPSPGRIVPDADGALRLPVTVERTETTMGFDLPEAYQWGVTVLGTDAAGREVRVIVPREQSEAVRNLEPGARTELTVRPADTPAGDDRLIFYLYMKD
ncbi:hypothetical protein KJ975_07250 [Myxococcota bacterium]|nr:hypothetical protein [Myxococcota bacterium]